MLNIKDLLLILGAIVHKSDHYQIAVGETPETLRVCTLKEYRSRVKVATELAARRASAKPQPSNEGTQ